MFASRYFLLTAHTSGLSEYFKRDFSRKEDKPAIRKTATQTDMALPGGNAMSVCVAVAGKCVRVMKEVFNIWRGLAVKVSVSV